MDYFSDWRKDLGIDDELFEELIRADKLEKAGEPADAQQVRDMAMESIDNIVRDHINDNGQLIEFDGGVIVSAF